MTRLFILTEFQVGSFEKYLKAISRKFTLLSGVDLKICLGFLLGKECPDSKNSGVLKTAEFVNLKTVNYINPRQLSPLIKIA